jgi:hypothetical protein
LPLRPGNVNAEVNLGLVRSTGKPTVSGGLLYSVLALPSAAVRGLLN